MDTPEMTPEVTPASNARIVTLLENINTSLQGIGSQKGAKRREIIGIIISVFSIIVTVYFSIIALKLTRKYGENTDQLKALTEMVSNQKAQTDQLIEVAQAMNTQNDLTGQQLKKFGSLLTNAETQNATSASLFQTAKVQGKVVQQQLLLSRQQSDKYKLEDSLENIADQMALIRTFDHLIEPDLLTRASIIDRLPAAIQLKTVREIKTLLEQQIVNRFFLRDTVIRSIWFALYNFTSIRVEQSMIYNAGGTQKPDLMGFGSLYNSFMDIIREWKSGFFKEFMRTFPPVIRFKKP